MFWDCLRTTLGLGLNPRIRMRGKWKRVSPRGNRVVGGSKRMNKNGRALGIYTRVAAYSFSFGESQKDHLVKNRK